jgi:hypothetical protein
MSKLSAFVAVDFFAASNVFFELRGRPRPAGDYQFVFERSHAEFTGGNKIIYPTGDVLLFAGMNSCNDPRTQIEHYDFERFGDQKFDEIIIAPNVPQGAEAKLKPYLAEGGTIRVGVPTL